MISAPSTEPAGSFPSAAPTAPGPGPGNVSAPRRRLLSCVGAGGVGKTTVAAALAIAGARQGKRVACLTIDPARRLASSLGLSVGEANEVLVAREALGAAGGGPSGSLTIMMLNPKQTFDELVRQRAPSPEVRERIFRNRVYQHMSSHLAGVQSYMAMEKVLQLMEDPRFDLVVLDTPPTNHALDFFAAPGRLTETLDSAALSWLLDAFQPQARLTLSLLARGARLVLRGLSHLTGGGFLEQVAEFIFDFNELFGGFRQRALDVNRALRSPSIGYWVVLTPERNPVDEAALLLRWLREQRMQLDGVIVNRHEPELTQLASLPETEATLARLRLGVVAHKVQAAAEAAQARAVRQTGCLSAIETQLHGLPTIHLPVWDGPAFGMPAFNALAGHLASALPA